MRVLQIANAYLKNKLYTLLFDSLEKQGQKQTVFVPVGNRESFSEVPENVHVVPCFHTLDRFMFFSKQRKMLSWLKRNLQPEDFDVVHAHTVFSGGYAAYRLYRRYGIPYVVAVRNTDVNTFFRYMVHLRGVGVNVMRHASRIIFLSPKYQETVFEKYIPKALHQELLAKSQVIPNGISNLFLENKGEPRQELGETIRLIYIGDVDSNKNLDLTLKAAQLLMAKGIQVTMTVVGRIKEESYRELMRDKSWVEYYERCPQHQLLGQLQNADIFVMPSHHETFGLVYAEAMSQGLPVLYTAGQGFDGHFPDGTVGYAVSDTDAEELAQRILDVVDNYEELSGNAVQLVERFDWDKIAEQYVEIYQEICE